MTGSVYSGALDLGTGIFLVCAIVIIWRHGLNAIVKALAVQGIALSSVVLILGIHQHSAALIGVAFLVLFGKGLTLPFLLNRVVRGDPNSRELSPVINVPASLVGAGALVVLAYAVSGSVTQVLPIVTGHLVPIGFATLLIGFFTMTVRRKMVSQIVGLLLVDNGIALVAFLATLGVPLLIEFGATFDVLLVVVVLRLLAVQMRSRFGQFDLGQLRELHD